MQGATALDFLSDKSEEDRVAIAQRVGERFSAPSLPEAERAAAEALARDLVGDAFERVRRELAHAVKSSRFLPRDVAIEIAHDVDAVACPFLEVTEIFTDDEWQSLVQSISRGARMAAARRASMSEGLAMALAQLGDPFIAEVLVENENVPITSGVCFALIDRFETSTRIMDALAERDELSGEIAIVLLSKVSEAVRNKLAESYNIPEYTNPIGVEAEHEALLHLIRNTPEFDLFALAQSLAKLERLTVSLLLKALQNGSLHFFEASVAVISGQRVNAIRSVVRSEGVRPVTKLLKEAHVPTAMYDDFWTAIEDCRSRLN